jgi:hypothetical protein
MLIQELPKLACGYFMLLLGLTLWSDVQWTKAKLILGVLVCDYPSI